MNIPSLWSKIKNLILMPNKQWVTYTFSFTLLLGALFLSGLVQAATYSLPTDIGSSPFNNCSLMSGTTYNCSGNLSFGNGDTINVTSTMTLNLTSGSLSAGTNFTINNNNNSFTINVPNGNIDIKPNFNGSVNLTSGKTINIGNNANITGNLTAKTLKIGNNSTVIGMCTPTNSKCTPPAPSISINSISFAEGNSGTINATFTVTMSNIKSSAVTFNYATGSGTATGGASCTSGIDYITSSGNKTIAAGLTTTVISIIVCGDAIIEPNEIFTVLLSSPSGATLGLPSSGTGTILNDDTTTAPAKFNCVEPLSNASTGHIYTKLAGSTFNFDVVALKADGNVETAYASDGNKAVTVELVDGSGSTACSARTSISPAISQVLTFTAANSGRKTSNAITVNKTYSNLRCRVIDANQSPNVISCSSDNFSVRPSAVTLTTSASAIPPSASAVPAFKSGSNFLLEATTLSPGNSNYSGTLTLDTSKLTAQITTQTISQQSGGIIGTLSPSVLTANTSPVNATYSEVGYLYLSAGTYRDDVFTAVDSGMGDCITSTSGNAHLSDTPDASGKYGCSIGNNNSLTMGRFYPDHFNVTPSTWTEACNAAFTYYGQDGFTTIFTITAQNSTNTTTQNYNNQFAKFDLTNYMNYGFSAATLPVGAALSSGATAPVGTWVNGIANTTAKHQISRPTTPVAETILAISTFPDDGEVGANAITVIGNNLKLRYGQLKIQNAYGSELLNLPIPLEAQYWNGTSFVRNQLDNCTTLSASTIAMGNYKNNLNACETQIQYASGSGAFVNGASNFLQLTKPGATNNGSVDLSINLNGAGGSNCTSATPSTAANANMPWFGINPTARATFGIYKTPIIYMRENY